MIDADKAQQAIKELCEKYNISYGGSSGGFAEEIAKVMDKVEVVTDAEATEHCGLDYIMGQYFSMKQENEKLRENNRNLEHACKVEQQRVKEATERIEAMQKRTADEPDNVAHWIYTPPRIFSRCSGCGEDGYKHYDYCPWCGRKMQEERTD